MVLATDQQHDLVLRQVGVLVFVYQHVLETLLVTGEHVGVFTKEFHHVDEQVVEVHGSGLHQPVLIFRVDLGVLRFERAECSVGGTCRVDELVLPQTDTSLCPLGRKPFRVEVQVANDLADQSL